MPTGDVRGVSLTRFQRPRGTQGSGPSQISSASARYTADGEPSMARQYRYPGSTVFANFRSCSIALLQGSVNRGCDREQSVATKRVRVEQCPTVAEVASTMVCDRPERRAGRSV